MREIKDTQRAEVRIGYDGRVHKIYRGPLAQERYENEVKMLKHLEAEGCEFVPRLLEADPEKLSVVTSNAGAKVEKISREKVAELFAELETYGVKHCDPFPRNITYSAGLGRFCIIDFEFASLVETGEGLTIEDADRDRERRNQEQGEQLK